MLNRTASGLQTKEVAFIGNTSGWEAYDYKVIIKRDSVDETYGDSGIVISADVRDREEWTVTKGVIVSIGSKAFSDWPVAPNEGQRVMIQEYVGQRFIGEDGEKYLIVNDKEIAAGVKS